MFGIAWWRLCSVDGHNGSGRQRGRVEGAAAIGRMWISQRRKAAVDWHEAEKISWSRTATATLTTTLFPRQQRRRFIVKLLSSLLVLSCEIYLSEGTQRSLPTKQNTAPALRSVPRPSADLSSTPPHNYLHFSSSTPSQCLSPHQPKRRPRLAQITKKQCPPASSP